jgi:pimeloyl-ACP methyl ester carboxylesterase
MTPTTFAVATADPEAPRIERPELGRRGARRIGRCVRAIAVACMSLTLAACATVHVRSARPERAAVAEIDLAALKLARDPATVGVPAVLEHHLAVARTSFAQLAFGACSGDTTWSADRCAALLATYNQATEGYTQLAFEHLARHNRRAPSVAELRLDTWRVRLGTVGVQLPNGVQWPEHLVAAGTLELRGIRNLHRRAGFGAPFVVVAAPTDAGAQPGIASRGASPPIESRFLAATTVLMFPGETLEDVLEAETATLEVFDPMRTETVRIGADEVSLAADFTAPYASWLAQEKLDREARFALLRRRARLDEPRIYLMQPYDRERRTLVLLHGLGASPESWANVVNDLLGDPELRSRYQIWQVFYPTNLPLPENRKRIREALLAAVGHFDPSGTAPASRGITLIGHSMGGVLARLLLVESDDLLWNELFQKQLDTAQRTRLAVLEPYLTLEPLRQVDTAVFIAAPHRGSPLASGWRGWLASHVVRLPIRMVETIRSLIGAIAIEAPREAAALRKRGTSIDNLSDRDKYLQITAALPIASGVRYHSIVGVHDASLPLAESSDGVVPYSSAHLDGAASELVVASRHGVHDTSTAIGELKRILRDADQRRSLPEAATFAAAGG